MVIFLFLVWRCAILSWCWEILGNHWKIQSGQILHCTNCHQSPHEIRGHICHQVGIIHSQHNYNLHKSCKKTRFVEVSDHLIFLFFWSIFELQEILRYDFKWHWAYNCRTCTFELSYFENMSCMCVRLTLLNHHNAVAHQKFL